MCNPHSASQEAFSHHQKQRKNIVIKIKLKSYGKSIFKVNLFKVYWHFCKILAYLYVSGAAMS